VHTKLNADAVSSEEAGGDATAAYAGRALGSALRLFVRLAPDDDAGRPAGDAAWDLVRAEFDAVDRALSRFRADSELTALNRLAGTERIVQVSWRLREALALMDRARRVTAGRFDAAVLDSLERIGERGARLSADDGEGRPPDPFAADLERPRSARVPVMPLDTGGIGKGLALRWAAARAMAALPPGSGLLLDAGGDVAVAGRAPAGGWRVGIEDPAARGAADAEPLAVIGLDEGAVATSSISVRHWTDPRGLPVHHIIDPASGEPARTGLIAVTVADADPAWSEVWTKALFLAGRGAIGEEARQRGLAAWWVDAAGRLGMTPAARERSVWVDEARVG
jgi:thiamine biosynthesis lipoprotein